MGLLNFKKPKKAVAPEAKEKTNIESPEIGGRLPVNSALIKRAWLSEKATDLGKFNQYVFLVQQSVGKKEIAKEVSRRWGVKVKGVNIIRKSGKSKRVGNLTGRTAGLKKAVVTLKEGEKLEIT